MDINATSFYGNLLDVFTTISESQFVSFDLELSGVSSKPQRPNDTTQTLQERYEEIKQAAERYQILQIGLTCVREVSRVVTSEGGQEPELVYGVQPYNFNLSPLLPERMGVERIFSFQSGAAEFLIQRGFRIELPFTEGVPYLSRDEAKLAKERQYARLDRGALPDIDLTKPEDATAVEFVDDVRRAIREWQKGRQSEPLEIKPKIRNVPKEDRKAELSRFEMRLVHQLVRAEFPKLKSLGKRTHVQIVLLDEAREKAWRKEKKKRIKEHIADQVGFRWIVEFMGNGDTSTIDAKCFARNPVTGEAAYADLSNLKSRWDRARDMIEHRRTVLVGHNLFTDLIYLYRTFIGPLPETVEEHARNTHQLFPRVIDTKYMATHNVGRIKPDSSLDVLEMNLAEQSHPIIMSHPQHEKYDTHSAYHEAGYDSLLTARVLIRLSTKLEALGSYNETDTLTERKEAVINEKFTTAKDANQDSEDGHSEAQNGNHLTKVLSRGLSMAGDAVSNVGTSLFGIPSNAVASSAAVPTKKKKKRGKKKKKKEIPDQTVSRFSQLNIFDSLRGMSVDDEREGLKDQILLDTSSMKDTQASVTSSASTDSGPNPKQKEPNTLENPSRAFVPAQLSNRKVTLSNRMPHWNSDFWRAYENKLRVFGTKEEVCVLGVE